jgi:thymidylate kinase
MIIVVEGTDNAGKTTLALSIAKQMKAIYVKSENIPPKNEYLNQYSFILTAASEYGNGIVISDRHHAVSEPIYGPLVRGASSIDVQQAEFQLRSIEVFIFCRPPNERITKTMNERKQMAGVDRNIDKIIERYDKFFLREDIRGRTWRYDWTKDSEQLLMAEIKRHT